MKIIYYIEKNKYGAWIVCGNNGIKQYYGYSQKDAKEKYISESKKQIFYNKKGYDTIIMKGEKE